MSAIVIYDGQCVLCRQSLKIIQRLDWLDRVEALDLQDQEQVKQRYPDLEHEALMGAIHVVSPDKRVLVGFFGMRYVMRFLPLGWLMLPLVYLPGMNWLGPRLYGWIAKRRYKINRLLGASTCEDGYCKIH